MRVVAIVQARVRSSRLPAKVLLDLGGRTALERCLGRVRRIPRVEDVVVAVPDTEDDNILVAITRRLGFRCVRGSEGDVLARYHAAACAAKADVVIRVTSDCPLLDPAVSGLVVDGLLAANGGLDYASNTLSRKLPRGLDTEVMTFEALERAHREATEPAEREHVTMRLYRQPSSFRLNEFVPDIAGDVSTHRWTLDTLEDYRFLFAIYEELGAAAEEAGMGDVLRILERKPSLTAINAHVAQKKI